jgi:TRAP-type C4-dicarboxylate transport system substrate-binding protein
MPLIARIAVITFTALLVAACGGDDTKRAGGAPVMKAKVLKLANGNSETEALQAFIDKVSELSDGRLRVEPANDWRHGDKQYEKRLIEDVAAGKADLGWVGSRALATAGVKSFEPLNAPFLLDSYEIEDQVLRSDATKRMLADLDSLRVTGLSVLPGPLRFLQVDREVIGAGDLAGLRIAGINSTVQKAALNAIGTKPVVIAAGDSIEGLDGIESTAVAIHGNGYYTTAKYTLADMPLWPRPYVMFANPAAWNGLTDGDRELLMQAMDEARSDMLADTVQREEAAFAGMCKDGNHAVALGAAERARLQQAVEPLLAELRNDPATHDAMAAIEPLGAGQTPYAATCPAIGDGPPAALEGTFEATMRKSEPGAESIDDFTEYGMNSIDMVLDLSDGRAVLKLKGPDGPEVGFDEAYTVFRDVIKSGDGGSARFELDGRRLRFTDVNAPPDGQFVWERTWIKTR